MILEKKNVCCKLYIFPKIKILLKLDVLVYTKSAKSLILFLLLIFLKKLRRAGMSVPLEIPFRHILN